ncbi:MULTISPECIES: amino acid ABC transporter permease [Candidatus Ichthyocystis]|uniref:Glutamine transport system permease protein n=1 Tax=Candidatus Ichthyocystis hellenicum TaxID=1561003 RepID=A0A0S4M8Y1_9BURK|nr:MULTISPECIES: amino acid ABC transporter permease [Ichthyocystis]CUT17892.1 Glutamine transport system permease protein [Candidatus Ichthyocystis hellenicum]
MQYNWDWLFFLKEGYDGHIYGNLILVGLGYTIAVATSSFALAFVLGTAVGVMATIRNKFVSLIAIFYINIFRNIPLLVQLFLWFFVVPEFLSPDTGDWLKQNVSPIFFGIIGLSFFTSSRLAVQIKAGIDSLPEGMRNAGRALGMKRFQIYKYILLPAALRMIIPSITSEAMNNIKNSSVTYAIGVTEIYFQYKQLIEKTSQIVEITCIVTGLYFLLNFVTFLVLQSIEKKLTIPGLISHSNEDQL